MRRTTIFLMIITLLSKLTGLIREQAFAYFLGTSNIMDAYSTASTIPFILFGSILTSLVAGYIPIYTEIKTKHGENKAKLFTSNLLNIIMLISTVFIAIIILIAPILVSIFAPAYAGEKREISIQFTRIFAFSLYPTMISAIFIAFLQMKNRFIISETPGIIMNFFHVITLIISVKLKNYYIIAYGILITEFLKYFLFPSAIKSEYYSHKIVLDFKDKYIYKLIKFAIPLLISISAMDLLTITDQSLASIIMPTGGVSSIKYGNLIYQLISGVIIVSITTSIYPSMSKLASENRIKEMKKTMMSGLTAAYILIIPSMIGIMILSKPLVKILLERGVFNQNSTAIISGVLFFYTPTILGFSIKQIINRGFYSLQNTKIPIYATLIQVSLNITLDVILSYFWGLNGLAIATAIASISAASYEIYSFRKHYGSIEFMQFLHKITKIAIISSIMGIFTLLIYNLLQTTSFILALISSIIISIFVFMILIIFARIPEVMNLVNKLYHRFIKQKVKKND
ncbi:murein biosynthesis integral membrane protein MurJ [Helcococcus bovis]|uniref:murein biosynthesis integral membrane protein MurJ n=1 Tax=Helcococcus bovis TaxID=3153252 RepID=UPI0038BDD3FB